MGVVCLRLLSIAQVAIAITPRRKFRVPEAARQRRDGMFGISCGTRAAARAGQSRNLTPSAESQALRLMAKSLARMRRLS